MALMFVLVAANSHAGIKAFLNQTTVYDGDVVKLTIESDRKISDQPNLSVLKQDFVIQSTSQGTSFSMVNGNTSFSQTWTIILMPKSNQGNNSGKSIKGGTELTIPAIQVGSETTTPIKLMIADVTPEVQAKNREHVALEAIIDIGETLPYVQQQIRYTLKLYTDDTVREGDIYPPEVENAIIEQISADKQYRVSRKGKKMNVLERHYVISPEKSGKLIVPPAIFKGKQQVKGQRARRGAFNDIFDDPFFSNSPFVSSGKPITARSDSTEIAVQTIPDEFNGEHWLPAEDLVIIDSWDKRIPTFRVGEPIERMLVLQAKGLAGSQIPALVVPKSENMRIYPDQEKTQTKSDGKTIFGIRQQGMSYIPNKVGKVIIPGIKVDWWNTKTAKQETFILKERVIEVLEGVAGNEQAVEVNGIASDERATKSAPQKASGKSTGESLNNYVLWIFVIIIVTSLLGYLISLVIKRWIILGQNKQNDNPLVPSIMNSHQLMSLLKEACLHNDNKLTARVILLLANKVWVEDPPTSLGSLANLVEKGSKEIKALDKSLYAGLSQNWQGEQLWDVLEDGIKPIVMHKIVEKEGLGHLYPER